MEQYGVQNIETYKNDLNLEFLKPRESAAIRDSMYRPLQGKQLEIVDNILQGINNPNYVGKNIFSQIN